MSSTAARCSAWTCVRLRSTDPCCPGCPSSTRSPPVDSVRAGSAYGHGRLVRRRHGARGQRFGLPRSRGTGGYARTVAVAVPGGHASRQVLACDGIRLAALVSVPVGLVAYGGVAGALFLLVLGGTVIPRALAAPAVLDASYCLTILFAAWAAELDWYLRIGWLDVVVHAAATGLIAAMVHLLL